MNVDVVNTQLRADCYHGPVIGSVDGGAVSLTITLGCADAVAHGGIVSR